MTYGINESINVNKNGFTKIYAEFRIPWEEERNSLHTNIDYTIWGSYPKVSVILFPVILHWSGRPMMQSKDLTVLKYDFS